MKKIQIGIMGSAADLKYSEEALNFAKELGRQIAKSDYFDCIFNYSIVSRLNHLN